MARSVRTRGAALVVVVLCIVAFAAGAARGAVLVRSTFDDAITGQDPPTPWLRFEYAGVFTPGIPVEQQLRIVDDPRRPGRAAEFIVNPGDRYGNSSGERALLSLASPDGAPSPEQDGADFYYTWSNLFPADWQAPPHWGIVLEFHADRRFMLAPIRVNVDGNSMRLDMTTGPCVTTYLCAYAKNFPILRTLQRAQWHDFVLHVHWSMAGTGMVAVWHRLDTGAWRRVFRLRGVPTLPSFAGQPATAIDVLFGLYTDSGTATRVVYGDNFSRATSFKEATAIFPPLR